MTSAGTAEAHPQRTRGPRVSTRRPPDEEEDVLAPPSGRHRGPLRPVHDVQGAASHLQIDPAIRATRRLPEDGWPHTAETDPTLVAWEDDLTPPLGRAAE